ncbi:MAG: MltA domain-containing protein [Pseudomonadota bacterium]
MIKPLCTLLFAIPHAVTAAISVAEIPAQQTYLCPNGEVIGTSLKGSRERRRVTASISVSERQVGFGDLPGWREAASPESLLQVIRSNCEAHDLPDGWKGVCDQAPRLEADNIHRYIEDTFTPFRLVADAEEKGLFTAYYASYVNVRQTRNAEYKYPIYRVSDRARSLSRRDIGNGALEDDDVLFWSDSAFDVDVLHIQGSGVGRLPDGAKVNISYAGKNRENYVSLGKVLRECGDLAPDNISLPSIRTWVSQATPDEYQRLINNNQSYVFFSASEYTGESPKGALAVPLTPMRSLAVDTRYIALGTMMYVAVPQPLGPAIERVFIAQDKGGAISGGIRADIFAGEGEAAELFAGRMAHRGRAWVLKPK